MPPAHGTGNCQEPEKIGGTRQAQNENYTKVCQRRRKWRAFLWLPKMPPGVDVVVGVGARVVESGKPTFAVAEKNTQITGVSSIEEGNTLRERIIMHFYNIVYEVVIFFSN